MSNPVEPVKFDFEAAKRQDLELYHQWKNNGDKSSLSSLVRQLHPVIFTEVRRASGTLPPAALSAEAKKWTVRAIQNFDPTKGVALSTHVTNYLPKIRRLNYKYTNSARLPENLHLKYTEFHNATSHLENELGRPPSDEEIAKRIGWSKPLVTKFKSSLYEDLVESGDARMPESEQFNYNTMLMDHLMNSLDTTEKTILENAKELSSQELADKLGVNIARLNYLKTKLRDKIQGIKNEIKMY